MLHHRQQPTLPAQRGDTTGPSGRSPRGREPSSLQRASTTSQQTEALVVNNEWTVGYRSCRQAAITPIENSSCFPCCVTRNYANNTVSEALPGQLSSHQSSDSVELLGRITQYTG